MNNKRVLITGGAGYIGSVLTRKLLEEGYKVTCLDNLCHKQESPVLFFHNPGYELIIGDARDESLVRKAVKDKDLIIPLAAIVGMPACKERPLDASTINMDAVQMINNLRSPNQKLIFPNTNSGYGTQLGKFYCTEETSLEPISHYGKVKCKAERALLESSKPVISLRLATVFGVSPRMRLDLLVNDFTWQAMNTGAIVLYESGFVRNYIHIEDVARAFIHADQNFDLMKDQPYNIGLEDANLSKKELALKIKVYFPELEIVEKEFSSDTDKRNYMVSNRKIIDTGFAPMHSLDDGIKELKQAYAVFKRVDKYRNA